MRRQSFLQGALILAVGGLLSRVLGAVYRIILPMLFGPEKDYGMGLLQYSMGVYTVALTLSSMGIPLAIAKLVSERAARNDPGGAIRVYQVAGRVLAALGAAFTVAMVGAAFYFQQVYDPKALVSMLAVAPAIFVVSIMSALRGLFQGMQIMTPFAASQVIEQIVRILTMFALAIVLLPIGVEFAAAGASFGAVTGAVAGLLYLLVVYRRHRAALLPEGPFTEATAESAGSLIREVLGLAVPMSLAALAFPLFSLVDTMVVPLRLHAIGLSTEAATAALGVLNQMAMPFVNLPLVFTTALALSVVPAVSEARAAGQQDKIRRITIASQRVTMMISLPAVVGLMLLATEIPSILWGAPHVGGPLRILAPAALFIGLQQVSSGTLQGLGYPTVPVRNLMSGVVVKLAATWFLTAQPSLGINGAATASAAGFLTAAALNMASVHRRAGGAVMAAGDVLRTGGAVTAMVVAVAVAKGWLAPWLAGDSRLAAAAALLVVIALGGLVYGLALLLFGGINKEDLDLMGGPGQRLGRLLQRLRLLRS